MINIYQPPSKGEKMSNKEKKMNNKEMIQKYIDGLELIDDQPANTVTIHADVIELKSLPLFFTSENLITYPERLYYKIYVSAYDADGYVVGGYGSLEHAMELKPNHRYEIELVKKK